MKKRGFIDLSFLALLLLTCLWSFISCVESEASYGTLHLRIAPDSLTESRSILPSGEDPLVIDSYQISAMGPFETLLNETVEAETEFKIDHLHVGYWNFTVTAFNADGTALIKGSAEIMIRRENNSALIILDELIGSGTLDVSFTWSSEQAPSEAHLKLLLLPLEGEAQELEVIQKESSAQVTTMITAGYYTLIYQLYLENELLGGGSEALRIIDKTTSEGEVEIIIGQVVDEFTLKLLNGSLLPLSGAITISDATVIKGEPFSLTFTPIWEEDISPETLLVKWYCDGTLLSGASSLTLNVTEALAGSHRYDVLLFDSTWGSLGSASALVTVATPIVIIPIENL